MVGVVYEMGVFAGRNEGLWGLQGYSIVLGFVLYGSLKDLGKSILIS